VMLKVAPLGPVYQAGTLSGNPVAVTAGLTTLAELTRAQYPALEEKGALLADGLGRALRDARVSGCVQRVGSMLTLFFHPGPVTSLKEASACDRARFAAWHRGLLERGVYWPPAQLEAAFLGIAHTTDDLERTVEAAGEALA